MRTLYCLNLVCWFYLGTMLRTTNNIQHMKKQVLEPIQQVWREQVSTLMKALFWWQGQLVTPQGRIASHLNTLLLHVQFQNSSQNLLNHATQIYEHPACVGVQNGEHMKSTFRKIKRCIIWSPESKDMRVPMQAVQGINCCARLHEFAPLTSWLARIWAPLLAWFHT